MLDRLVTDSSEFVHQKLRVWAEKPYKIHDFHRNTCRHLLENVGWPSKLCQSTHNLMLDRFVADSMGGCGAKICGLGGVTIKYS